MKEKEAVPEALVESFAVTTTLEVTVWLPLAGTAAWKSFPDFKDAVHPRQATYGGGDEAGG